jgi:hypothetical protein
MDTPSVLDRRHYRAIGLSHEGGELTFGGRGGHGILRGEEKLDIELKWPG